MTYSVDDSSIENNSGTLRIKALGVTNAMLEGSIDNSKLANKSITVTAGSGLTTGGSVDLGGSVTLDIAGTIPGNKVFSDDVTINGNLVFTGEATTINSTNTDISDNLIVLNSNFPNDTLNTNDSGILIERGNAANAFMGWDESDDKFVFGTTTATGTEIGDLTITEGTIKAAGAIIGHTGIGTNTDATLSSFLNLQHKLLDGNSYALLQSSVGDTYLNCASSRRIYFRENGDYNNHNMVIWGGKVGIGTDEPQTKLHIEKNGDPRIRVVGKDGNDTAGIDLCESFSSTRFGGGLLYDGRSDDNNLILRTYNDNTVREGLVFNRAMTKIYFPNGKVGIGTDSPKSKLDISGGNIRITQRGPSGQDDTINGLIWKNSAINRALFVAGETFGSSSTNEDKHLYIGYTEDLTINNSSYTNGAIVTVRADGNVGIVQVRPPIY